MADRRTPDEEAAMTERLRQLGDRIGEVGVRREKLTKELQEQDMESQKRASNFARGFQLSGEFVAGILVGGIIGWSIDHFAGTSPWGLIVLLMLGFAAGTLNVMRSAGVIAQQGETWTKKD
jgi:ATP synthase protein I